MVLGSREMGSAVRAAQISTPHGKALAASIVLIASLLFARFTYYQSIVVTPAIASLLVCVAAYFSISALIRSDSISKTKRRNPLHPLVFTTPSAWSAVLIRQTWESQSTSSKGPTLLSSAPQIVKTALDRLLQLIQRHFILPWYTRISTSPAFPNGTDTLIRHAIANLIHQGENVDWSSLLVSRLVPIIKDHLQHYRNIEHLASTTSANSRTALPLPLPAKSHPALSTQNHTTISGVPPLVEAHLRAQTELILAHILPEADRSEVVCLLVRELLLGAVLLPVYEMLCDPDFWNRQIDDRGGRYLHEQYVYDFDLS